MDKFYTDEKNTQILISLLKSHEIKRIVASPGTTNIRFVASVQQDPFFEVFSAPDERSAAYIACGMAVESGEPVVLSCTGATASRNYVPGLTEAFYRKIPVLAVTSTQHEGRIGQNIPQVIDRSVQIKDTVKLSVTIPTVHTDEDAWACNVRINQALLELKRYGCGPVHINLETTYSRNFSIKKLDYERVIKRKLIDDEFPCIDDKKVCIFVGAHKKWNKQLTDYVDRFCEMYNAAVLCDSTSNYRGKYRVFFSILTSQEKYMSPCRELDLVIHIGDVSGAYPSFKTKEVWRVNEDGEVRDTFKKLSYVFAMSEEQFFSYFIKQSKTKTENTYISEWNNELQFIRDKIDDFPFSNIWIAQQSSKKIPNNSVIHFGILNSLRSWNFFDTNEGVDGYSNTGGFGIDGILSTVLGASMVCKTKLFFCILGDLAFFYDINSLGNRHIGNNLRIMLINNGVGTEFKNYNHPGADFGETADAFIAARGHYGEKSPVLVKHYAEDLGFQYLSANNKEEYLKAEKVFFSSEVSKKPIIFEVFTNSDDESDALKIIRTLYVDPKIKTKDTVSSIVGRDNIKAIKKLLKGKK